MCPYLKTGSLLFYVTSTLCLVAAVSHAAPWHELEAGLELAGFKSGRATPVSDSLVVVLRIDPQQWDLDLYCASQESLAVCRDAVDWTEERALKVATNAGMFAQDRVTHVGYLKREEHVNNGSANSYLSAAAFGARQDNIPPFRIFDLDAPGVSLESIRQQYDTVVQNLRLIKRPRENRWSRQDRIWGEMALGEDSAGRVLLVFCRSPYSMRDFNQMLLSLPIDVVAAQHLEGGPEAQLVVSYGDTIRSWVGSYETGFNEHDLNLDYWPRSNVIGVGRRVR